MFIELIRTKSIMLKLFFSMNLARLSVINTTHNNL